MIWGPAQEAKFEATGVWGLDSLELRIMLFYEFRADYMSGYTYHERDHFVQSLLEELRGKAG